MWQEEVLGEEMPLRGVLVVGTDAAGAAPQQIVMNTDGAPAVEARVVVADNAVVYSHEEVLVAEVDQLDDDAWEILDERHADEAWMKAPPACLSRAAAGAAADASTELVEAVEDFHVVDDGMRENEVAEAKSYCYYCCC